MLTCLFSSIPSVKKSCDSSGAETADSINITFPEKVGQKRFTAILKCIVKEERFECDTIATYEEVTNKVVLRLSRDSWKKEGLLLFHHYLVAWLQRSPHIISILCRYISPGAGEKKRVCFSSIMRVILAQGPC